MLERFVDRGVFPGGVAAASVKGERILLEPAGHYTYGYNAPVVTAETMYDLASVSKVYTSVALLILVDAGQVDLGESVRRYLPALPGDRQEITLFHLLTHTAGLPSVPELHATHDTPESLFSGLCTVPLEYAPGESLRYTSLGYQYIGWVIERVTGLRLDQYIEKVIVQPCHLRSTFFCPPSELYSRIVPTEYSPIRRRLLQGDVHDENSGLLGGITGHTGLFSTAEDVLRFGEALLFDEPFILTERSRQLLFSTLVMHGSVRRSTAFVVNDPLFGDWPCDTYAHTGFTGTSLCLVPSRGLVVVLLSNRVYPTRANDRIQAARREFHSMIRDYLTT